MTTRSGLDALIVSPPLLVGDQPESHIGETTTITQPCLWKVDNTSEGVVHIFR